MLRLGSVFSGIGGLELGLEWSGLGHTVWQVEQNPFCRAVLAKRWPNAIRYEDIRLVRAADLAPVDLICGGFPCQDVSSAGKGAGLAGERSSLWREFARLVGEIQPEWVVVENVTSGAGRWFDAVVRELEQLDYAVLPLPLSARDVGAPHLRKRLFVVAHRDRPRELQPIREVGQGRLIGGRASDGSGEAATHAIELGSGSRGRQLPAGESDLVRSFAPNTELARREGPGAGGEDEGWERLAGHIGWASEPGMVPLVHGLPGGLAGRRRRARIRALGNAVVPQDAEVGGWVVRELIAQNQEALTFPSGPLLVQAGIQQRTLVCEEEDD
jgi:DNA (cytosine-5)-methyltransferase 1